jgi:predicted HAD superfamily Cof-like phosphohydrolase
MKTTNEHEWVGRHAGDYAETWCWNCRQPMLSVEHQPCAGVVHLHADASELAAKIEAALIAKEAGAHQLAFGIAAVMETITPYLSGALCYRCGSVNGCNCGNVGEHDAPDMVQDVLDFHLKLLPDHPWPTLRIPPAKLAELKRYLVDEEYGEELALALDELVDMAWAIARGMHVEEERQVVLLANLADGAADTIYFIIGACLACGIDLRPVWRAVHAANMQKTGGPMRADGKILKPEGWQAPDVEGVLRAQAPLYERADVSTLQELR